MVNLWLIYASKFLSTIHWSMIHPPSRPRSPGFPGCQGPGSHGSLQWERGSAGSETIPKSSVARAIFPLMTYGSCGMIWYDLPTYCVVISYLKYLKVISYLKLLISYLRYLIDTHQQLSAPKHQLGHVLAEKSVQACFKDASGSLGIRFIGSTYHS